MPQNSKNSERLIPAMIFISATAFFGAMLWYIRHQGMLSIDDAFITFRYAENIARHNGFVYNLGERTQGTTTPLFCLLLAGFRVMGMSVPLAADVINLISSGLAAMLVYLVCREAKDRGLALTATFLFVFFPHFWMNLATGMETMFFTFLCLLAVWLDLKKRPVLFGAAGALLLMTRIDGLALLAAVLTVRFFRNPGKAILAGFAVLVAFAPWLIFSYGYFGSLIPHSILAKKLIHILPARLVLWKFAGWFPGLEERGGGLALVYPALIAYLLFAILGSLRALSRQRWALVFILWIIFYLAGIALGRAGIFFWYKIPMLSGYLILAAIGIQGLCGLFSESRLLGKTLNLLLPATLSLVLFLEFPYRNINTVTLKESANLALARAVKANSGPGARVLAGEVGIVGFELMDYYMIDSAGLVSDQVYQIRLEDKMELIKISPSLKWDWWGSVDWVNKVLDRYHPDFILSDVRYLHLQELLNDPQFNSRFQLVKTQKTPRETVILLKKSGTGVLK